MKLAIKFSSILILGIIALLGFDAYISVRRERELYRADMEHDARLLGDAMKGLVAETWATKGQQRVLQLIDDANRQEEVLQIRWVWLDGQGSGGHQPRVDPAQLAAVRQGAEESFHVSDNSSKRDGELVTYVPVKINGTRPGALELSESMVALQNYTGATVRKALGLMSALLAISGVAVVILGTLLIGRPLRQLAETVRRIGQGDLSTHVELRRRDELGELAGDINTMARQLAEAQRTAREQTEARIAAVDQLRHADRLSTVGTLASGVAHEVGTPLNVISARAKRIANEDLSPAEIHRGASIIGKQSERIAGTIRQLLDFARSNHGDREPCSLRDITERSVALLHTLAERRRVSLRTVIPDEDLIVTADGRKIEQVLTNLVVNGIQAMPQGGQVEVRLDRRRATFPDDADAVEQSYACICVSDEGTGIAEENLHKVFEPFFTTKDVGEGTGLGLSLAHGIVREHGGWIEVVSRPGQGTAFTVYLPLESPSGSEVGTRTTQPAGPDHTG